MSLTQLESQIDDLRAQVARLYAKGNRTTNLLDTDPTLSDIGKQKTRDAERDRVNTQIRALREKETELIADKKQSLERRLFGLSSVASSDPGQIIAYRDAQDRAARLTYADDAREALTSAIRSDDKTLAAAVLSKAVDSEWHSVVDEYVKQNPSADEDLADLAKINQYNSFEATLAYALL